jgi:hypothetical protein
MRQLTALVGSHQIPLLECRGEAWIIWISYDKDKESGTYLTLLPTGKILRSTQLPTGEVVGVATITPRPK